MLNLFSSAINDVLASFKTSMTDVILDNLRNLFTDIEEMMMISYQYGNAGLSVASRKGKCKFRSMLEAGEDGAGYRNLSRAHGAFT